MRTTVLHELTLVHDDDLVKVKYCVEFVGDGDKGMVWEPGTKEALDMGVACSVKTEEWLLAIDDLIESERWTYLLVASSMTTTVDLSFLSIARAKQKSWRCPCEK